MAMTRRERFDRDRRRARDEEKLAASSGVKMEVGDAFRCDECKEPMGTLYAFDKTMLCWRHVPFEYRHGIKANKMVRHSVSGRDAILRKRKEIANGK